MSWKFFWGYTNVLGFAGFNTTLSIKNTFVGFERTTKIFFWQYWIFWTMGLAVGLAVVNTN